MTGVAAAAEKRLEPSEPRDGAKPASSAESGRRGPRRFGAMGAWRMIGWLASAVAGTIAIAWFVFFSPGESGSKAQWFFGAAVLCVVMVTLWQTVDIQRQAHRSAADSAERLRQSLTIAEQRAARELALTQSLHQTELEAQQRMHRAEMESRCEQARLERRYLLDQLQKQAVIEVSRSVNAMTAMLATLWNRGASILRIEDRDEREQAMNPIFEQISQLVRDFSVELDNAHLLAEDERVQEALHAVNDAAVMAIRVAEDVHAAVVDGRVPQANPIPPAQQLMRERAAQARRLAWDLVRTGLQASHEDLPRVAPDVLRRDIDNSSDPSL
jgi:hypothetical protein